jgi:peptidoglycan/LPS O-acetylase OafA/YrhL
MLIAEFYLASVRLKAPVVLALIGLGVVGVALKTPTMDNWWGLRGLVWGPLAAAILAGAALWPPGEVGRVRRGLEAVGDASYSLYLAHYALFLAIAEILRRIVDLHRIPALIYFIMLVCAAIGGGFATYRFFESPVTRPLQRKFDGAFRTHSAAVMQSRSRD